MGKVIFENSALAIFKYEFQAGLAYIAKLVKIIGEKLETEIDTRKNENFGLKTGHLGLKEMVMPLSKIQKRNQFLIGILTGLAITIIGGIVVYVVTRYLK